MIMLAICIYAAVSLSKVQKHRLRSSESGRSFPITLSLMKILLN